MGYCLANFFDPSDRTDELVTNEILYAIFQDTSRERFQALNAARVTTARETEVLGLLFLRFSAIIGFAFSSLTMVMNFLKPTNS
jgi:hypothetical protein